MDATRDYNIKWNKSEKDINDITYTWNLKYDTNKLIYKIETDSQTENVVANAVGEGQSRSFGLADANTESG